MIEIRQTLAFRRWRADLNDDRVRSAIEKRLVRIQGGNFGDAKYIGDGVGELRFYLGDAQ